MNKWSDDKRGGRKQWEKGDGRLDRDGGIGVCWRLFCGSGVKEEGGYVEGGQKEGKAGWKDE